MIGRVLPRGKNVRGVLHYLFGKGSTTSFGLAALGRSALGRNSLVLAEVRWQASLVASDVVWWPARPCSQPRECDCPDRLV